MKLNEISRRGFLKGVGAAGALSVAPAPIIQAVISTFVKDVGGVENLNVLSKLLTLFGPDFINTCCDYISGDISFGELLSEDEERDLAKAILSLEGEGFDPSQDGEYDIDDSEDLIRSYVDNYDFDGNIYDAASELIGRDINYKKVLNTIEKQGIEPDDFFDFHDGVGSMVNDAYMNSLKSADGNQIDMNNLANTAKEVSLPARMIRIASMISNIVNKVIKDTEPAGVQTPPPAAPHVKPLELPAPSNNDDYGLSNIERMKDLSGIPRK